MSARRWRAPFALLLLVVLASPLTLVRGEQAPPGAEPLSGSTDAPTAAGENLSDKVQSSLLTRYGPGDLVTVFVATSDVPELARFLQGTPAQGLIGTVTDPTYRAIALPIVTLPAGLIPEVAALPSTLAVFEYAKPEKMIVRDAETFSGSPPAPFLKEPGERHRVPDAWASGYTGQGVVVAVPDDGVDFSHPDLQGTAVRFNASNVPADILERKPWLAQYDGWPMAFDPFSIGSYLSKGFVESGLCGGGTWYANTTSTDPTVWHTVCIDGRNDFWTDGSELVADDPAQDAIAVPAKPKHPFYPDPLSDHEYDVETLYVTQDAEKWYFGWKSKGNTTNFSFGLYIDITNAQVPENVTDNVGGAVDPIAGTRITPPPAHKPDFVVYLTHWGSQPRGRWDKNDTIENATFYRWNGTGWDPPVNVTEKAIGGEFAYGEWDFEKDEGFVEFSVPKTYLRVLGVAEAPSAVAVELFSADAAYNDTRQAMEPLGTRAFDTAYSDPAVPSGIVWWQDPVYLNTDTPLSAFVIAGRNNTANRGFWQRTYTRPDDVWPLNNTLRTSFGWNTTYLYTGTSSSGKYLLGNHPDENYPQTRVLVVDECEPERYDTVYVDLDSSRDFRNDKPVRKWGTYTHLTPGDNFCQWNPPGAAVVGERRTYDELSWMDFFDPAFGVTSLAVSPNGTWLASGAEDHTVALWAMNPTPVRARVFHAHAGRVTDVAWSPNGTYVAATYDNRTANAVFQIVVWRVSDGAKVRVFPAGTDPGHTANVTTVRFSPDGTRLVTASFDGTLKFWNVASGQLVQTVSHGAALFDMDWANMTDTIAAAGVDGNVSLWDGNGAPITTLVYDPDFDPSTVNPLASVAFNPNGTLLAGGGFDGNFIVWDVASEFPNGPFGSFPVPLLDMEWHPLGFRLALGYAVIVNNSLNPALQSWVITNPDPLALGMNQEAQKGGPHFYTDPLTAKQVETIVPALAWNRNGTNWLLSGGYDAVIRPWNVPPGSFTPARELRGHEGDGSEDKTRYDTGDGIPDISGGMVYFIAGQYVDPKDGSLKQTPVPYSETYAARNALLQQLSAPKNGTLVAFMGALDKDASHGTLIASTLVGGGRARFYSGGLPAPTPPQTVGFAPDAKLLPIADVYVTNFFDGWYFAVEGYDGAVGTGDEANIVSNSFGFSSVYYDGLDFYSRFVDWIVLEHAQGKVTFTMSAGNAGPGYGTVTAPSAASSVITVGASSDFWYRRWIPTGQCIGNKCFRLEEGVNPTFGDLASFSSRGPTAAGRPDPDVVANGRMSFGAIPLNQAPLARASPVYDGSVATQIWSGTSLSSPSAAGVLALAFQAYGQTEHWARDEVALVTSNFTANRTTLGHHPVVSGTLSVEVNGSILPPANYALDPATGNVSFTPDIGWYKVVTATYRFTDEFPDSETARSILMSGADDLKYDPFSQGAGFVNALRATAIAAETDGFRVTPNLWMPGDYQGVKYPSFPSHLARGGSETQAFTVLNGAQPDTLEVSSGVFQKFNETSFRVEVLTDPQGRPLSSWAYVSTLNCHNRFAGAGCDMSYPKGPGAYIPPVPYRKVANLSLDDWRDADLLNLKAIIRTEHVDPNQDGANDFQYFFDLYDWSCLGQTCETPRADFTNLNRINIDNPTANMFLSRIHSPAIRIHDGLAIRFLPVSDKGARFNITITLEFYRRVPWNWLTLDGGPTTTLSLAPGEVGTFDATVSVPATAPYGIYQGAIYLRGDLTSTIDTHSSVWNDLPYMRLSHGDLKDITLWWNGAPLVEGMEYWVNRSTGFVAFNATSPGAPTIFDNVQADYTYYNVTTIPIAVNVPSPQLEFSFGGTAPGQDEFYGNHVDGGFGNGPQSGDWRFYHTEVPNQGRFTSLTAGARFYLDVRWDRNRTDVDAFAFGRGGSAFTPIAVNNSIFGPYLYFRNNGGSEETSAFFTSSGRNREVVAPAAVGGLNIIAVRHVRSNGTANREAVWGTVGTMEVNPPEIVVATNRRSGSVDLTLRSSVTWDGLGSVAGGPSAPQKFVDLNVSQDKTTGDFNTALSKGSFTYPVQVRKDALIFDVHITSTPGETKRPCPDLDLGVFIDGLGENNNPDGRAQPEELVAINADGDADEHIRIIRPKVEDDVDTPTVNEAEEGVTYLIKVLGFTVPWAPTGTFNMELTLVQGQGFTVLGQTGATLPPHTLSTVTLAWNLPGNATEDSYLGAWYVGPGSAPLALLIPVELIYDTTAPNVTGFEFVTPLHLDRIHRITDDTRPYLTVGFDDFTGRLDGDSVRLEVDDEDVTDAAVVTISFETRAGKPGWFGGGVVYRPAAPFLPGPHHLNVTVGDTAGNLNVTHVDFNISVGGPLLGVAGPSREVVTTDTVFLEGQALPRVAGLDVALVVRPAALPHVPPALADLSQATAVVPANDGQFRVPVILAEGTNSVEVWAIGWRDSDTNEAGAWTLVTKTFVYDVMPPRFDALQATAGNLTAALETEVTGIVADPISAVEDGDPMALTLVVSGRVVPVSPDGSFRAAMPLLEGVNGLAVSAVDAAGWTTTRTLNVTRDTTPPPVTVDPLPASTAESRLTVRGVSEADATVALNGGDFVRLDASGAFTFEVTLSPGRNVIVVQARDAAGNVAEVRQSIVYAPGVNALPSATTVVVTLLLGLLGGYLISSGRWGPRVRPTAETAPAESVDERAAKLKQAFEEGKISREAYEAGLAKLGLATAVAEVGAPAAPPAAKTAASPTAAEDERLTRLREAVEQGKMSQEAYERNLAKVKQTIVEERIARLRKAFDEGKISRETYKENLKRLQGLD